MKICVPGLRGKLYRLGVPALALLLWLPLLAAAQNPACGSKNAESSAGGTQDLPPSASTGGKKAPQPPPGNCSWRTPEASAPHQQPGGQPQQPPKLTNPTAPRRRPEEEHKPTIESIIIRGNRRIPAGTLRARIFSHPGDIYDETALERDFMALWNTGFLDDVRLEVADAPERQ